MENKRLDLTLGNLVISSGTPIYSFSDSSILSRDTHNSFLSLLLLTWRNFGDKMFQTWVQDRENEFVWISSVEDFDVIVSSGGRSCALTMHIFCFREKLLN